MLMVPMARNLAVYVILTLVTCGLFGIYWMVVLNDDSLAAAGEAGTGGWMVVFLTFITCGIYGIYWSYQLGRRIDRINAGYGRYTDNSGLLYLLLCLFGLSIVIYAVAQNELNHYADSAVYGSGQ